MKHLLALFSVGFATVIVADDALVTEVAARQNWPWSPDVNITYRYNGTNPTSVWFTATWQGQTNPVDLVTLKSTGTFLVSNGLHRLTWDPVAAGYGKEALVDFKVQAVVTNADPRTYLVVDLVNGGYTLRPDVPSGGWTDEYRKTKMVFRRVPAGTYQLGFPEKDFYCLEAESGWSRGVARGMTPREVTLSSDYYCAIYLLTAAQKANLFGVSGTSMNPQRQHDNAGYRNFRGATLDDGVTSVDWPNTGYAVSSGSYVGKLRQKLGGDLLGDLPTQEQWEIAMRAGTSTIWPTGGDKNSTGEELDAAVNKICWCRWLGDNFTPYSKDVGLKECNGWGIYDFNVMDQGEVTISYANDAADLDPTTKRCRVDYPTGGLDPVGPTSSLHSARIFMGGSSYLSSRTMRELPTPKRAAVDCSTGATLYCGVRLAIHLKPLVAD